VAWCHCIQKAFVVLIALHCGGHATHCLAKGAREALRRRLVHPTIVPCKESYQFEVSLSLLITDN
jgi:hypothetical protein